MSELSSMINQEKDNIKSLIMQKKKRKTRQILIELTRKVNESNKIEFYDFLGELLRYNCDYFVEYGYNPLLPKIQKLFSDRQLLEMEEYIIKNFSLSPEEELLSAFNAVAVLHKDKLVGRMYLTNRRIIGLGKLEEKKKGVGMATGAVGALTDVITAGVRNARRRHIRKALKKSMPGEDILFFGHQVPINEAFKIKKGKGAIVYIVILKEKKKIRIKTTKMKVKIIPKPMKNESSKDFRDRRAKVLNAIADSIYNLQ